MLFDRPYTKGWTPYGSFDLVTWSTTLKVRVVSNHSVLPIGHDSVLPCNGSVLLSLLLGGKSRLCRCLVDLGSFTHQYSRHSVEVRSMSKMSALTSKSVSAVRSCLRIHLGCLTGLLEQSIWSPRLPQKMQRRSSRCTHTSFGIPLALTM
jgi:hypothetical protein